MVAISLLENIVGGSAVFLGAVALINGCQCYAVQSPNVSRTDSLVQRLPVPLMILILSALHLFLVAFLIRELVTRLSPGSSITSSVMLLETCSFPSGPETSRADSGTGGGYRTIEGATQPQVQPKNIFQLFPRFVAAKTILVMMDVALITLFVTWNPRCNSLCNSPPTPAPRRM